MSSGAGRGRGWLNLEKDLRRPGGVPSVLESLTIHFNASQIQQYKTLLQLIEQLDPKDDGILLNHKLKNILKRWKADTKDSAEVEESFKYIYAQCRKSSDLSKRLVAILSTYSFSSVLIHDARIRTLFIQELQNDFENRVQLQAFLPTEFRNSLCMLTEFYHKVCLSNGCSLTVLAIPTLSYLDMLLDSGTTPDLELFTTQLYLNSPKLREQCSEKLQETLVRVRQLLIKSNTLISLSRTWLLLALDVSYNRFSQLPLELRKFYEEELGEAAIVNLEGKHGILQIDVSQSTQVLKTYENVVNILKRSPSDLELPTHESANNYNNEPCGPQIDTVVNHENVEPVNSTNNRGRPILGVGARLQKHHDPDTNWREEKRTNVNNWESTGVELRGPSPVNNYKPYVARKGNEHNIKEYRSVNKFKKGWEHDDRFDTDYE